MKSAAIGGSYATGNREAEPGSSHLAGARLIGSVEPLAKMRKVIGLNANSCISNREVNGLVIRDPIDGYTTSGLVILNGVVDQDQCRFVDKHLISQYQGRCGGPNTAEGYLLLLRQRACPANERLRDLFHVNHVSLERLLATVESSQRQQVVRQGPHVC